MSAHSCWAPGVLGPQDTHRVLGRQGGMRVLPPADPPLPTQLPHPDLGLSFCWMDGSKVTQAPL